MEKVSVSDLDSAAVPGGGDQEVRRLADALGTTDVAINHYTLDPGEVFTGGMHTHMDQEEVFYVMEGTATFETPDETVEVGSGEAVRFAPGDFQQGRNESDDRVVALALGAPKESEDVRVPQPCPDCGGSDTLRVIPGDDGMTLSCPECDHEMEMPG